MGENKMNILFTSSGRRVSLIKQFKDALKQEGIKGNIFTADLKETAPTIYFSHKHFIVPRVNEEGYINELLKICRSEMINLIIPLIDTELTLMANNSKVFEGIGVKVLVSSMELNKIANNKKYTYNFFASNNIPTPKVYSDEEIERKEYQFPLLIKPYDGSSSKGVTKIMNEKELEFFKGYIPNAMIQEYVSGEEYTIDVMVDFCGNIKTIVPRLRIETRAGEVSKGMTKKDFDIIQAAETVIKALPNPIGCITLQCFKKEDGQITFIEINPRFGGGIPLSIEAGANFPLWTIKMCQGEVFIDKDFNWRENLTMLRYDEAVFMESI
ncbi:transcriptional regulator [Bacillus cereus]|nr:transcriptional regulator [Bacillus cereus]